MTYEGWTNRETWAVMLWLNNDFGAYQKMCLTLTSNYGEVTEAVAQGIFNDAFPRGIVDVSKSDMENVNWREIAVEMAELRNDLINSEIDRMED